jgi:hypothetical protein
MVLLVGCVHQTYSGTYYIQRDNNSEVLRNYGELVSIIESAIIPFGFVASGSFSDQVDSGADFYLEQDRLNSEIKSINGSNASITIAVRMKNPYVVLRDHSNVSETAFVKSLKMEIESSIRNQYEINTVFIRQSDML